MSATDLIKITRAADYAARQHIAQKRKGDRAEPYINHLTEVAVLLAEATGGKDPELIMGGLLHDTLEDTESTYEDLAQRFGPDVAALVAEVTDDKSLSQRERKRVQIEHAPGLSRRAKLLKIADKTSNLRGLVSSPPSGWSQERLRDYVDWAEQVVRSCRGLNGPLEAEYDKAYQAAKRHFGS